MRRERGNDNLCGCASSMKLRWYIIIQPPGLCGVCYIGTTSTVVSASEGGGGRGADTGGVGGKKGREGRWRVGMSRWRRRGGRRGGVKFLWRGQERLVAMWPLAL